MGVVHLEASVDGVVLGAGSAQTSGIGCSAMHRRAVYRVLTVPVCLSLRCDSHFLTLIVRLLQPQETTVASASPPYQLR